MNVLSLTMIILINSIVFYPPPSLQSPLADRLLTFSQFPDIYMHHSVFQSNSGLPIGNLLNFIYIPLDIFLRMPHNELTELEAWLYFLSSDNPKHIQQIIEKYPFFKELYRDIINLRYHPKELISMYSEALYVADQNTIKLMIDELKQELQVLQDKLSETQAELNETQAENIRLRKHLANQTQE